MAGDNLPFQLAEFAIRIELRDTRTINAVTELWLQLWVKLGHSLEVGWKHRLACVSELINKDTLKIGGCLIRSHTNAQFRDS